MNIAGTYAHVPEQDVSFRIPTVGEHKANGLLTEPIRERATTPYGPDVASITDLYGKLDKLNAHHACPVFVVRSSPLAGCHVQVTKEHMLEGSLVYRVTMPPLAPCSVFTVHSHRRFPYVEKRRDGSRMAKLGAALNVHIIGSTHFDFEDRQLDTGRGRSLDFDVTCNTETQTLADIRDVLMDVAVELEANTNDNSMGHVVSRVRAVFDGGNNLQITTIRGVSLLPLDVPSITSAMYSKKNKPNKHGLLQHIKSNSGEITHAVILHSFLNKYDTAHKQYIELDEAYPHLSAPEELPTARLVLSGLEFK